MSQQNSSFYNGRKTYSVHIFCLSLSLSLREIYGNPEDRTPKRSWGDSSRVISWSCKADTLELIAECMSFLKKWGVEFLEIHVCVHIYMMFKYPVLLFLHHNVSCVQVFLPVYPCVLHCAHAVSIALGGRAGALNWSSISKAQLIVCAAGQCTCAPVL